MLSKSTLEKMKVEATRRLRELNLYKPALNEWEKEDRLYLSEETWLGGILYWADQYEDIMKQVNYLLNECDLMTYHVIRSGDMLTFLVVDKSCRKSDLRKRNDKYGFDAFAYVSSPYTFDGYDAGTCCIDNRGGGLIRTY